MPINYSIAMYSNPIDEDVPKKAYARSQHTIILTLNKFAEHIASHDSKYNHTDIYVVLMQTVDCMRETLLGGSGSIEQNGDTVPLLFHPAKAKMATTPESNYPVTPDMQMLIVAKNRNGTPGTVYLSHNPSMTRFCEYAPDADWLKHLPAAASSASGGNKAGE